MLLRSLNTTLDAETLASDFVSASLQEEILETASGKENDNGNSLEQRYLLLYKLLKNNTYSSVERNTSIQLNNLGSSSEPDWEITHSSSLENELVGGLITYLSDPDLVPPAETLTVYLKTLQKMDVQQMANYLGLDSILNTSDSAKMPLLLPLWNSFTPVLTTKYQAPLFPDILLRWTQSSPHLTVIPFLHNTKKN